MNQFVIALTGCLAIWLSQDTRHAWRRWACVFGLAGQPFWFYAAWSTQQWGVLVLTVVYTASWIRGVRNHWLLASPDGGA